MSDYITRDSAKGAVSAMLGIENLHTVSIIFGAMDLIPAADVEEVRHAKWEWDGYHWHCSYCNNEFREDDITVYDSRVNVESFAIYCPICGAKTDGGNDETT